MRRSGEGDRHSPARRIGHLMVFEPGRPARRVALGQCPVVFGRSSGCDEVLVDQSVSRRHAAIGPDPKHPGHHVIRDLGSTNGVHVAGRAVHACRLRAGDLVALGEVRVRACEVGEPAPPPADSRMRSRRGSRPALAALWQLHCQLRSAGHTARRAHSAQHAARAELGLAAHRHAGLDLPGGQLATLLAALATAHTRHTDHARHTAHARHTDHARLTARPAARDDPAVTCVGRPTRIPSRPGEQPSSPSRRDLLDRIGARAADLGVALAARVAAGEAEVPNACLDAWHTMRRVDRQVHRSTRRLHRARRRLAAPPPLWWLRAGGLAPPVLTAAVLTAGSLPLLRVAFAV